MYLRRLGLWPKSIALTAALGLGLGLLLGGLGRLFVCFEHNQFISTLEGHRVGNVWQIESYRARADLDCEALFTTLTITLGRVIIFLECPIAAQEAFGLLLMETNITSISSWKREVALNVGAQVMPFGLVSANNAQVHCVCRHILGNTDHIRQWNKLQGIRF